MKVLIWIVCFFVLSVLIVLLKNLGIVLGGVPTVILYLITWWGAKTLTKKLDSKCKDANSVQSETVHPVTSENVNNNTGRTIEKRVTLIISFLSTTLLLGTVVAFFVNVKNNKSVVENLEMQIESQEKEIVNNEKELSNTKDLLLNKNKELESANIALEEQSKLVEKYFNEAEMWKSKALDDVTDESDSLSNEFSFNTVADLKKAIKYDPYKYYDVEIQVKGTLYKSNDGKITALVDSPKPLTDYNGVEFRYQVRNNPNINIVIADEVSYAVAENGDYIIVCGVVKIVNEDIYLDSCEYSFI